MENHFSILSLRILWAVWKAKIYDTERWPPKLSRWSICYMTNNSKKNELMAPMQKQCPVLDVTGDARKVWCDKEQYCIGIWNVMSMNQGKLKVVKQEMARLDIDILAIGELKCTRMGEFNSNDHYIYYCGQESLRRNGVVLMVNRSSKYSAWVQSPKWQNDLGSFPRQTIPYQSNPSLCSSH